MPSMDHDAHHEHLVKELTEQLSLLFEKSTQGIYLYLDDMHKSCNKRFSDLLGYDSPDEWQKNEFPIGDVIEEDQEKGIHAYMHASEEFTSSTIEVRFKTKKGKTINSEITFVPLPYKDEVFVLHFISPFTN